MGNLVEGFAGEGSANLCQVSSGAGTSTHEAMFGILFEALQHAQGMSPSPLRVIHLVDAGVEPERLPPGVGLAYQATASSIYRNFERAGAWANTILVVSTASRDRLPPELLARAGKVVSADFTPRGGEDFLRRTLERIASRAGGKISLAVDFPLAAQRLWEEGCQTMPDFVDVAEEATRLKLGSSSPSSLTAAHVLAAWDFINARRKS